MSMLQATATGASESPLSDMELSCVLPELNEKARNLSMDYPWIIEISKRNPDWIGLSNYP